MSRPLSMAALPAVCVLLILAASASTGCRSKQHARVIQPGEKEMVGSHQAGNETFRPLIEESVAKLLARSYEVPATLASYPNQPVVLAPKRICFIGVENKSAEEIGDFKEQIYQCIDGKILESGSFQPVSRRFVEAGLRETRLRPDELFVPAGMRTFTAYMEQQGHPFDYLLYATITSGTTRDNKDYQRDYLLTLDLVDVRTGQYQKESATLSKGYHHSAASKWSAMKPWK
jgi:hypothetical protein